MYVLDSVDISSEDSTMPNCNLTSHKDISNDRCIGCDEDIPLIENIEIIKIHDITSSTKCFTVFFWCFDSMCLT